MPYGWANDYKAPALKLDDGTDQRPLFLGGFDLKYAIGGGNNTTTLNSIRVNNNKFSGNFDDSSTAALYIENAANVLLQNTEIKNANGYTSYPSSVWGMYASNSSINFDSLNESIEGESSISSEGYLAAYALAINKSVLNFRGGANTISCMAENMSAYGIIGSDSIVDFNGGINTIGAISQKSAYGIYIGNLKLSFNGGTNVISSSVTNATANSNIFGVGAWGSSTVSFNGGTNTINSTLQGDSQNNPFSVYGINIGGVGVSELNFNGGKNTINSTLNGVAETYSSASGISAQGTTLNFNGGNNYINSTASAHSAYGIKSNSNVTISFGSGSSSSLLTINTYGSTQYGIHLAGQLKLLADGNLTIVDVDSEALTIKAILDHYGASINSSTKIHARGSNGDFFDTNW